MARHNSNEKQEYIACLIRMLDLTNEDLQQYSVGDFVYRDEEDKPIRYYQITSLSLGKYSIVKHLLSSDVEILVRPNMIIQPIIELRYLDYTRKSSEWYSVKHEKQEECVTLNLGNYKDSDWGRAGIGAWYWKANSGPGAKGGRIEKNYFSSLYRLKKVDKVDMVAYINMAKADEENRIKRQKEEQQKREQNRLEREKLCAQIPDDAIKRMIDSL